MASDPCDGCDAAVPIGGGIGGFWSSEPQRTGGMTLELTDGTEHFLCFECIERLPDDPSAVDVRSLPDRPRDGGDRAADAAGDAVDGAADETGSDGED